MSLAHESAKNGEGHACGRSAEFGKDYWKPVPRVILKGPCII